VKRPIATLLAGLSLMTLAAGCSDGPKEKPVYKVRGKLTYRDKPMAKALVSFYALGGDRSTPAHATADENGRYVLHTYRADDGAPAGDYVVTVYWPAPRPKPLPKNELIDPVDADQLDTVDRLKNQYSHAASSQLRTRVEPRDNEIDFKLP
jgi:hypothetical protein